MHEPDQAFFADPAIDRAVGMIMALAAELSVTRDRLETLERVLAAKGVLGGADLDAYAPGADEAARRAAERDAFVAALLAPVLGRATSKSSVAGDGNDGR